MLLVAFATALAGGAAGLFRSWYVVSTGADLPNRLLAVDMPGNWVIIALSAICGLGILSLLSAPRIASALFLAAALGYGILVTSFAVPASIFLAVAAGSSLMHEQM